MSSQLLGIHNTTHLHSHTQGHYVASLPIKINDLTLPFEHQIVFLCINQYNASRFTSYRYIQMECETKILYSCDVMRRLTNINM